MDLRKKIKNFGNFIQNNNNTLLVCGTFLSLIIMTLMYCHSLDKAENSNQTAKKANKIALQALNQSKQLFTSEYRPYVIVRPNNFKGEDSPVKIYPGDKQYKVQINYLLKNKGNAAAKNILFSQNVFLGENGQIRKPINLSETSTYQVSLGPNETWDLRLMVNLTESEFKECISEKEGIVCRFGIEYSNEMDLSIKYKSPVKYRIFSDGSLGLISDVEKLKFND